MSGGPSPLVTNPDKRIRELNLDINRIAIIRTLDHSATDDDRSISVNADLHVSVFEDSVEEMRVGDVGKVILLGGYGTV
jgi:hypothetical protein